MRQLTLMILVVALVGRGKDKQSGDIASETRSKGDDENSTKARPVLSAYWAEGITLGAISILNLWK